MKNHLSRIETSKITNGSFEDFGFYLCSVAFNQFKTEDEFTKNIQILIKILNIDYSKTCSNVFSNLENRFNENMFFGKYKEIISYNDYNKLFS